MLFSLTNSEIAKILETTAKLLILHGEEERLSKSYEYGNQAFRRTNLDFTSLSIKEIATIGRISQSIAKEVKTIAETNTIPTYERLKAATPEGIQELLFMKGLGAKSLRKLWAALDINNAEDLLSRCRRNELLALKGYGQKSQDALKERLLFFISRRGYQLLPTVERIGTELVQRLLLLYPDEQVQLTGKVRRKEQILKRIDILHTIPDIGGAQITTITNNKHSYRGIPVVFHQANKENYGYQLLSTTGPENFVKHFSDIKTGQAESELFNTIPIHFIPPEIRHQTDIIATAKTDNFESLITVKDIKGSLHMHTTDSDGIHSLEQMVKMAEDHGYEYLLITDHSKSAGYANGLQIDRLLTQIEQIKILNQQYKIKIYSGIESDILTNGALDYPDEILAQLDIVIASVHSGLKMNIQTATDRILKAIHNPYTKIMGHLTGRLLTQREGYPVDHKKILDACAETGTVMELNANPSRLDMDEKHIRYAMQKGVKISINPDAHAMAQLPMMQWGVNAARRGGLTKEFCLNALDLETFDKWVSSF